MEVKDLIEVFKCVEKMENDDEVLIFYTEACDLACRSLDQHQLIEALNCESIYRLNKRIANHRLMQYALSTTNDFNVSEKAKEHGKKHLKSAIASFERIYYNG